VHWLRLQACAALAAIAAFEAGAAIVTISESPQEIVASTPGYRVRVQKAPYALSVQVGGREILGHDLSHSSGARSRLRNRDRHLPFGPVLNWSSAGDRLFLVVQPEGHTATVDVSISFRPDHVSVHWRTRDPWAELEERFPLRAGGHWYGGSVTSGHHWPLEAASLAYDPYLATSNQAAPVWFASSGAGIFLETYDRIGCRLNRDHDGIFAFHAAAAAELEYRILIGRNIVEAHRAFIQITGKPAVVPPFEYFAEPVFNTWIEYQTRVTQADVESYARKIRESGFPSKVLMLDDGWASHYGDHTFNREKFPDPKRMVEEVHRLGFQFVLWVVPFIETAAANYERARSSGYLVLDRDGRAPASVKWWNGEAALVDLSNPAAYGWFLNELETLQRAYGVDGFKLDAGDAEYFDPRFVTARRITPNQYTDLYASLGRHFSINELRVSWLTQRLGLVQRLRDKSSSWSLEDGLGSIVRHGLAESLIGYPFFCPDIIGGGLDTSFKDPNFPGMDEELFIRWTQASALMPMMQFSFAPWRLGPDAQRIVRRFVALHRELAGYIYRLAEQAKQEGTPIVRPLFFRNPEDEQCYLTRDQFLLGERFLVAPVLVKGATARDVYLPAGLWKDFWAGTLFHGPRLLKQYPAPLEQLPIFVSLD